MKKVLLYAIASSFGGIEEYLMNILRFDDDPSTKYGVVVFGNDCLYIDEIKKLGVSYYVMQNKYTDCIKLFKDLVNEYDVLYFNTSAIINLLPYYYAKKYGYKIILHSHSSFINPQYKRLIHYINRTIVSNITYKRFACSDYAAQWMFPKETYEFIPNAIDLSKFQFNEDYRKKIRDIYNISDDVIVLGYVARLTQSKNHAYLLEVMKLLKDDTSKNYCLMLVGDGELDNILKQKAFELGVDSKVVFVGSSKTSWEYYSAFDIYVMPSLFEGFPLTAIEAQASGLRVIISDTVTRNINITNTISYLALDNKHEWMKTITECKIERVNNVETLKSQGFDIVDFSEYIYRKLVD